MLRLELNALFAPYATGLVHLGCQGNKFLFREETGENLYLPAEGSKEGLLLLERVDL